MYTGVHILPRPPFRRNALENPIGLLSDMARNLRRLSLGKPPPPRSPPPPPRCRPLPPRCRPARPRGPRIGCRPAACPAGGALGGRPAAGRRPENGQNATGSLSGRRGPAAPGAIPAPAPRRWPDPHGPETPDDHLDERRRRRGWSRAELPAGGRRPRAPKRRHVHCEAAVLIPGTACRAARAPRSGRGGRQQRRRARRLRRLRYPRRRRRRMRRRRRRGEPGRGRPGPHRQLATRQPGSLFVVSRRRRRLPAPKAPARR